MANYYLTTRTNYFHVKDPDKFRALMEDFPVAELRDETDDDGHPVFAFGYDGAIGCIDPYDEEAYYNFIAILQEHVADDDAVIITEISSGEFGCVAEYAVIVTSKGDECVTLIDAAKELARKMLSNDKYDTTLNY